MGTTTETVRRDSMTGDRKPPEADRWFYEKIGNKFVVRKSTSPFALWRDTEKLARIACDKENADDDAERIRNAAPDMLKALLELEWIFDRQADINNNGGPNDAMIALQVVSAAIDKATGAA